MSDKLYFDKTFKFNEGGLFVNEDAAKKEFPKMTDIFITGKFQRKTQYTVTGYRKQSFRINDKIIDVVSPELSYMERFEGQGQSRVVTKSLRSLFLEVEADRKEITEIRIKKV